jgi:hypothetical protein
MATAETLILMPEYNPQAHCHKCGNNLGLHRRQVQIQVYENGSPRRAPFRLCDDCNRGMDTFFGFEFVNEMTPKKLRDEATARCPHGVPIMNFCSNCFNMKCRLK